MELLKPDLCVIGAGSGGLSVAAGARAFGASVVIIERGEMGGDCLNTGCVPSKSLIAAARHAEAIRQAPRYGVDAGEVKVNFGRVNVYVHSVIDAIAPHDSAERFTALGARVIKDHARFTDRRTVRAGDVEIRARRFVIAAGSRAAVPPIPGLSEVPFLTNETIFGVTRKPQHLIVIGGGAIGLEMAQAHRRLGSEVTVIEAMTPLHHHDGELAAVALRRIAAEGVDIRAHSKIVSVAQKGAGVAVTISGAEGEATISGSHLLVATGRTPNVEDLGLEAAGIQFGRQGIKVDSGLKTSNRRVFAIGDIAGGLQFTHVAGYHAGLVVRRALFGLPANENNDIVPWAIFTDPEIATVGLTEEVAGARHGDRFRILRWSFAENDRARADGAPEGLVKLITARNGKILGCGIVGPQAGELISLFSFAIANGMKVGSLLKFVAPYPTLSEIAKRVGVEFYRDQLASPIVRRWIKLIGLLP